MFDLNQKYFGLSVKAWLFLVILVAIIMYTSSKSKENFSSSDKIKVFNFNTKWCGYSVQFQPIWNQFSKKNKSNKNLEIIDVKCDDPKNKNLCEKYEITGFPSVVYEKNGKVTFYEGERSIKGLEDQLNNL